VNINFKNHVHFVKYIYDFIKKITANENDINDILQTFR